MEKHPGFQKASEHIAKAEGISEERASAILASSSRHASAKAKADNPRLKRVEVHVHQHHHHHGG